MKLSDFDRRLIEATQSGLPLVPRPYEAVGAMLGLIEARQFFARHTRQYAWERFEQGNALAELGQHRGSL